MGNFYEELGLGEIEAPSTRTKKALRELPKISRNLSNLLDQNLLL